jgi:hypothetical protein
MIALLKMSDWDGPRTHAGSERGLERRMFARKEVHAEAEARRLDHSLSALRRPALKLALHDLSYGGLCAISDTPIAAGERVSVFIPPTGLSGGWNAYGRVVRCVPSGMGYRVGVEFDPLPAA